MITGTQHMSAGRRVTLDPFDAEGPCAVRRSAGSTGAAPLQRAVGTPPEHGCVDWYLYPEEKPHTVVSGRGDYAAPRWHRQ